MSTKKVLVDCVWSDNIQAATVNIAGCEARFDALSTVTNTCPSVWRFATRELLGLENDEELLGSLFSDPAYFTHLQRTIAEELYQRRVGIPSQETRVLKIQTENETYQNMGNCLIRTREADGVGLDIMFTTGD